MFESVSLAPPDPTFGLNEVFRRDPRPEKIDLIAGVYRDETGRTPVPRAVKEAERRLLDAETSKNYLPIEGLEEYDRRVEELLLGTASSLAAEGRLATVQTPGGTGALRVACDVLRRVNPELTVWVSEPTWPNHPQIFEAVELPMKTYPYFDRDSNSLAWEPLLAAFGGVAAGDVVVLHGCCHNPTGIDPTAGQWERIGEVLAERGALPLVDFAYLGFARDLTQDTEWLRILLERVPEILIATSFSKNFGLYNERTGALTAITPTVRRTAAVFSQLKRAARANYSNPPTHGASIVVTILGDEQLRRQWEDELAAMRRRIRRMRELFTAGLDARGAMLHPSGNGFITRQNGMFFFSGLTLPQVEKLRDDDAIYAVDSGRINVAGMNEVNMDRLCDAVAAVCCEPSRI